LYPAPELREDKLAADPLLAAVAEPGSAGPARAHAASPEPAGGETTQNRISVVLNLSVDFGPEDGARIERLQESLRAIAANERIEIVRAEEGSLRLFVADPDAALARTGIEALRNGLAECEDADLTGMLTYAEYERLADIRAAFAAASTELLSWPTALPGGETIDRPEMGQVRAQLDEYAAS